MELIRWCVVATKIGSVPACGFSLIASPGSSTSKRFETLTQTFVETDVGSFNAHHYHYRPIKSARSSSRSISRLSSVRVSRRWGRPKRELSAGTRVCADARMAPRWLRTIRSGGSSRSCATNVGAVDNCVLVGDALHTGTFSIGSGYAPLRLEDAIALDRAPGAVRKTSAPRLLHIEAARRPTLEKMVSGANGSATWSRTFCRAYAACAGRFRYELHHTFRSSRHRTVAKTFSALRWPI